MYIPAWHFCPIVDDFFKAFLCREKNDVVLSNTSELLKASGKETRKEKMGQKIGKGTKRKKGA